MHSPYLSIIIPMYNCKDVICRCLSSIDYKNCEILIIDDGSEDGSYEVVQSYKEGREIIRLFQQKHKGVSAARNLGIEKSNGKYIMFIDADDYIVPGGISRLQAICDKYSPDVIKYRAKYPGKNDSQDTDSVYLFPIDLRFIEGKAAALTRFDVPDNVVWDGLYNRSLIVDNNIFFKTDLAFHEDDVFMGEVYAESRRVIDTNLPLYRYLCDSQQSADTDEIISKKRIDSNLPAVKYRLQTIQSRCPDMFFPLEKYKHMRFVAGGLQQMIKANYSFDEFLAALSEYKQLGCWPISNRYIKIAQLRRSPKRLLKTFILNHPAIVWLIMKIK